MNTLADYRSDHTRFIAPALALTLAMALGCSGRPARVVPADIDYEQSASKAIGTLDLDGDGQLSPDELSNSPALATAFERVDANKDTLLSRNEIADYLRRMQQSGVAMVSWTLRIMLDGKPVEGATVVLEPAEFLKPGVLPAEGVSDSRGLVTLAVAEEHRPAPNAKVLHCGIYNVLVSKRSGEQDLIPQRYTAEPSFGVEVRPEGQADYSNAVINLSSNG